MKVNVDRDLCCSNGVCVVRAPQVFKLDGTELEYDPEPDESEREQVEEAVEMCPTQAISIIE
jgi:ferredoxin